MDSKNQLSNANGNSNEIAMVASHTPGNNMIVLENYLNLSVSSASFRIFS